MVSRKEFEAANARAEDRKATGPTAAMARFVRSTGRISVTLNSDIEITFPADRIQGLQHATPADLSDIEITPSGFGLHFPKLDADIYVPALLEGLFGTKNWMAASLGKKGGSSRSRSKAEASRANGKLGGRPRKASSQRTKFRSAG